MKKLFNLLRQKMAFLCKTAPKIKTINIAHVTVNDSKLSNSLQSIQNEIREIKGILRQGLAEIRNAVLLQTLAFIRNDTCMDIQDAVDFVDGRLDPNEFFKKYYV